MNNKIVTTLLVILVASVGVVIFQNYTLGKKIDGLSQKEGVEITPVNPQATQVTPFGQSAVDPMAALPGEAAKVENPTTIKFDRILHDFGKINEGEKPKTVFRFTNTGKNPLIISSAMGSCGCTVPKWPQKPIPPGGSDEIAVEFNSEGKKGENDKTVTVNANTEPAVTLLTIKATVIPKDK